MWGNDVFFGECDIWAVSVSDHAIIPWPSGSRPLSMHTLAHGSTRRFDLFAQQSSAVDVYIDRSFDLFSSFHSFLINTNTQLSRLQTFFVLYPLHIQATPTVITARFSTVQPKDRKIDKMRSFLVTLAAAATLVAAQLRIETPTNLAVCQPALLMWAGGSAPYYVSVIPGGQPSAAALKDFGQTSDTKYTWNVDLPAGQEVSLRITDSTGAINYSEKVTIRAGSNTNCLNGSSSAASGAASATAAAGSGASSASSGVAASASSVSSRAAAGTSNAGASAASATGAAGSAATSATGNARSTGASVTNAAGNAATSATSTGAAALGAKVQYAGVFGAVAAVFGVALF